MISCLLIYAVFHLCLRIPYGGSAGRWACAQVQQDRISWQRFLAPVGDVPFGDDFHCTFFLLF